jgi:3-(3-hydroxy-phenyl)propionate hydroxylase
MLQEARNTQVLVVGFGPTGATIANLLGTYGVQVLAIDKATEIFPKPRAISLDNEALRALQLAGLPEGAFDTLAIPEVRMHSPAVGLFARIRTAGAIDGHPKLVTFHQPELEAALRARVEAHPSVSVRLGVELTALEERGDHVHVVLRDSHGGTSTVRADYVVGADGASSKVREMLGLGFDGETYAEDWLIVDAKDVSTPIDHVEFLCDPCRPTPHMVAPGNRQRWEFMLRPGETREEMEDPEKVRELLAPWGSPESMEIERTAVYRFHARTVDRFGRGRVFLAGDAAHVTPPFVGQGLVAGLRDAINLSWKLAWVIQGRAHSHILESYDQERRPHAKAMIDLARFMGRLVMPRSRLRSLGTSACVRVASCVPVLREYIEDLKIKPKNRFQRGLFVRPRWPRRRSGAVQLAAGDSFPQVWLGGPAGQGRWSDDVLGVGISLVGFGVDPDAYLGDGRDAWRAAGGTLTQLCHRGQRLHRGKGEHVWEDISGALIPEMAPMGWAAIVRPDRTVMHHGPMTEVPRLVRETLYLLDSSSAGRFQAELRPSRTNPTMEATG